MSQPVQRSHCGNTRAGTPRSLPSLEKLIRFGCHGCGRSWRRGERRCMPDHLPQPGRVDLRRLAVAAAPDPVPVVEPGRHDRELGQVHDRAGPVGVEQAWTGGPTRPWRGCAWPAWPPPAPRRPAGRPPGTRRRCSRVCWLTMRPPAGTPTAACRAARGRPGSSIGLTSRLISGCTSRMELATTNGGASRSPGRGPRVLRAHHQRVVLGLVGDPLVDQGLAQVGQVLALADPLVEPVDQPLPWPARRRPRPAARRPGRPARRSAGRRSRAAPRSGPAPRSGDSPPADLAACSTRAALTSTPSSPRSSEVTENGVTDSASTWE